MLPCTGNTAQVMLSTTNQQHHPAAKLFTRRLLRHCMQQQLVTYVAQPCNTTLGQMQQTQAAKH
jgi:hypothetical protein